MRITFLLENSEQLWGGVKVALEDANLFQARGHQVTIVSRTGQPPWMSLDCAFRQVSDFGNDNLPDADVIIGTFWSTMPFVAQAGPEKGIKIHFCQGYEGDNPENETLRDRIEATYRLPGMHYVTISDHLTRLLKERYGHEAHQLRYVIDHDVHFPGPPRQPRRPLRVGIVGPYTIPWKDLPTGYAACELAHQAGQELVLVRATNVPPHPVEQTRPFEIEWHQELRPDQMGDYYRSLDVFLGTSCGQEEGFFLPAVEAMACGVPSVLTSIPCFMNHEKIVGHDRYALFVEPRDAAAMAEAMVLAGALPDIRAGLRQGGIEVANCYRADVHVEQYEKVLGSLLAASGRALAAAPSSPNKPRPTSLAGTPLSARRIITPTIPVAPPETSAQPIPPASAPADVLPTPDIPQPAASDPVDPVQQQFTVLRQFADELREAAAEQQQHGDADGSARLLEAAQCLDVADQLAPDLLHDAQQLEAAGRHAQALELYDQLLREGRDEEALHSGRGHCLQELGRAFEAIQELRVALADGARTPDNYTRLGVALLQSGNPSEARSSFERALGLDPTHEDARARLQQLST